MEYNKEFEEKEKRESPFAFIRSVIFTVFVTWFLMNYVIINAVVPSGSMENTIMTGDRLIGIRLVSTYQRGDIVIFPDPETEDRYLIKRIIGLPGETVEIKDMGDGTAGVYINDSKLSEDYLPEPMIWDGDFSITLPEDGYFMMGDNRNHSYDARYWGRNVIYSDEIVGVAKLRYWPLGSAGFIE